MYEKLIRTLSRVTSSGRFIPEIDGLRFIAISTVFVQHAQQAFFNHSGWDFNMHLNLVSRLVQDWRIGVELFFVISGFILGLPFASYYLEQGPYVPLKQYYFRRLTRLEPPYILAQFICLYVFLREGATLKESLPHFLAALFYLHNIIYHEACAINPVTWSLEIEIQFYILAPLLAKFFSLKRKRNRRVTILGVSIGVFLLRHAIEVMDPNFPPTLLGYLPYFMMGLLLADIYVTDWKNSPKSTLLWDWIAIPGWLLLPFMFYHKVFMISLLMSFILFSLMYCSFQGKITRKILANPLIRILGGMCYSIYLLHNRFLWSFVKIVSPGIQDHILASTMQFASLAFLVSSPLFIAYFLIIEKPCMQRNWPQKLFEKLVASPQKTTATSSP